MSLSIKCLIIMIVSMTIIVLTILIGIIVEKRNCKYIKNDLNNKVSTLSQFQILIIGFFLAAIVAFFPMYYFDYLTDKNVIIKCLKAIVLAAQNVLRLITLNGEYDNIKNFMSDTSRINAILGNIYSIYLLIIFIGAPILTASFVLSFFKNTVSKIKYFFKKRKNIYYISELNEYSFEFAKNILSEKNANRKNLIIFTNVKVEDQMDFELINTARRLGTICLRNDITSLKFKKNINRKLYFISENEDENINKAFYLIKNMKDNKVYNNKNTEFYVFTNNAESSSLIYTLKHQEPSLKMKIRRVNMNHNLAINALMNTKDNIFTTAKIDKNNVKVMQVLLVGLGGYGYEFLKNICWCSQMPGYSLTVNIFDKDNSAAERIAMDAPEILELNDNKIAGEAMYKLKFYKADVNKHEFINKLNEIETPTIVYVMLGDDELNIKVSMIIRQQLYRKDPNNGLEIPIYTVIEDKLKNQVLRVDQNQSQLLSKDGKNYNIQTIGDVRTIYSLANVEEITLEEMGLKQHYIYVSKVIKDDIAKIISNLNLYLPNDYDFDTLSSTTFKRQKEFEKIYLEISDSIKEICEDMTLLNHINALLNTLDKQDNIIKEILEKINEKFNYYKDEFDKDEYNRNSSISRAIYLYFREILNLNEYDSNCLKDYEHRRWNVWLRFEGYIYDDKIKDGKHLSKTHPDLISFYKLDKKEQEKDDTIKGGKVHE